MDSIHPTPSRIKVLTGNLVQAIADGEVSIQEARVCAPDLLRLQSIVNALVDVVSA